MAFWTYMLHCADLSYYTGHTDDLEKRVAQHESGTLRGYTHQRRPVVLVWAEYFQTREEALTAEIKIKNWSRAKKESLIARDWDRLKRYSRPPRERNKPPYTTNCMTGRRSSSSQFERSDSRERRASLALGIVPRLRSGGTGL